MPEPLPPSPPLRMTPALVAALSAADLAVGRLDGISRTLPNKDLFVGMYVRKEALLSSQIEGTQASLTDVIGYEMPGSVASPEVREVVNHVEAMIRGLARLDELPLSGRLVREIHGHLVKGTRGSQGAGEFRDRQNWIGPAGAGVRSAMFVPPPPQSVPDAMGELEKFWNERTLPPLVRAALAHVQFETIHPFFDGNGRVGRLLITFMLVAEGVLHEPLLYLSHHLKANRARYYELLQAVRDHGRWEDWLEFFLGGVREVADESAATAASIVSLREQWRRRLGEQPRSSGQLLRVLDVLFEHPLVSVGFLQERLGLRFASANDMVGRLVEAGLLIEATGQRRNRRFLFESYLDLFEVDPAR